MKNIIIKTALITLIFTLISCSDEVSKQEEQVIKQEGYLKLINNISENSTKLSLEKEFYNNNKQFVINEVFDKIGSQEVIDGYKNVNGDNLDNIFGKNNSLGTLLNFRNGKSFRTTNDTSFYIPNELTVSITGGIRVTSISPGCVLNWNVDNNNTNGLFIIASYVPTDTQGEYIKSQNPAPISVYTTIPENTGTYTITSSDLGNLPQNSIVNITIGRAGYATNSEGTFIAETKVSGLFTVNY